jgi:hypothetical protein
MPRGLKLLLTITTLAQIPATVSYFSPHPDIASDVQLNEGPFSMTFQVINRGPAKMEDVRVACEPSVQLLRPGSMAIWKNWDSRPFPIANVIRSGEAATFSCPATDIQTDGELALVIKTIYQPPILAFDWTLKRGFLLTADSHNKSHWLREPVK